MILRRQVLCAIVTLVGSLSSISALTSFSQAAAQEPANENPAAEPAAATEDPVVDPAEDRAEVPATPAAGETASLYDGETLSGWSVIEQTVFKRHGDVSVKEGAIHLAAGTPATGIVWQGEPLRMNYEIRLEARRVEGSDFFCGLTFPVDDSYCTLVLGGWGGGATGLSNVDDLAAIENLTTEFQEFENGTWYPIRLRVTPERIQAWIEDRMIVDIKTDEHRYRIWWEQEPARPLGITSWYTTSELRKIELQNLTEPMR